MKEKAVGKLNGYKIQETKKGVGRGVDDTITTQSKNKPARSFQDSGRMFWHEVKNRHRLSS
jgi:hypothetical protein